MKLLILQIIFIILKVVGLLSVGWIVILIPMIIAGALLTLMIAFTQIAIRLVFGSKRVKEETLKFNNLFNDLIKNLKEK